MRTLLAALLLASLPAVAAQAAAVAETSALCTAAIADAEMLHQTPPNLLGAIAKVESGRPIPPTGALGPWPWSIDADGQAYFLDSKAQAVALVRTLQNQGARFIDVGCLQIDLAMHPGAFRSLDEAFDPAANARYAARFLRSLYEGDAGGSWPVAVGFYHSHTPALAEEYRARVADVGAGIIAGSAGSSSLYLRALRRGTLHLALAGGGMLNLNLNRQPARVRRPVSACRIGEVLGSYLRSPPRGCGGKAASG